MNLFANTIIDLTSLVMILLIFISGKRNLKQDYSQSLFDKMLLSMVCYLLADIAGWYVDGRSFPGAYGWQLALNSIIYFAQIVCSFLWLLYTDYWIFRSEARIGRRLRLYAFPLLLETGLLLANLFTGWIFRINEAHLYVRGPYFLPSMLVFYGYALSSLFLAVRAFLGAKEKQRRVYCIWMAGFMVLPCASSLILALCAYGISVTAPFFSLSLLMLYLNVHQKQLIEEREKVAQRDAELQKMNVAIMLSQIQPHFLYNSLTSIYGLCETNPKKAQEAVGMFSYYLRFNMDSLRMDRPIPFVTELAHVKTYAALEEMRFDDMLHMEWDVRAEHFMIPPLTVQPLVENAVKHGLGKSPSGGVVTVSTREYEDRYTVTVADDGVGFDTGKIADGDRTHIGIANVRERLLSMSRATLAITSSPGQGTTAVITIPKEAV